MSDLFRQSMGKTDAMREVALLTIRYLTLVAPDQYVKVQELTDYIEEHAKHPFPLDKVDSWRDKVITKLRDLVITYEGWAAGTTYRLAPGAKEFLADMLKMIEEGERAHQKED